VADEIRLRTPRERPVMTARERQTLTLIAEGLSAPDIGRALHLSTATVKTHLQHIYEKLGVSERAAAVAEAMRRGLLE
jgi:two-component system nitrate/nitrite response regulator NarL